jgi:hydrogenase maturation protease
VNKTLLLGLGNDILGDDAIGLRVAAAAGERLSDREDIQVHLSGEMGLSLLDQIVGYNGLIIIDAVQTHSAPPGFVHDLEETDLPVLPSFSPHFAGVGELLALGRELSMAVPGWVRIFAVEVVDPFTVNSEMTPMLQAAFPEIVRQVVQAIRNTAPASRP